MKTIEEINEEIKSLYQEKRAIEEAQLSQTLLGMFEAMEKPLILEKIQDMMNQSPMLKDEVKRLLLNQ